MCPLSKLMADEAQDDTAQTLSAELDRALVRELLAEWKQLNLTRFRGTLRAPALLLSDAEGRLGLWRRDTRTLELSRGFVLRQPWGMVVEVLKHEMAHQYVHEVLGETEQTAHGPAFQKVCQRLGIDAAAAGLPRSAATTGDETRAVERIARLLALAESPNRHEAEAAMAAAQRLMLKYNLEACGAAKTYGFCHLGVPTGRVGESERLLAMILGNYFFVEVIWVSVYRPLQAKRGSVLEVCGTPANLAMAEYVHSFLTQTAEQLWHDHKRAHRVRSNRDRRTYLAGVMSGFAEKLAQQQNAHCEQGLIWVRDADLSNFLRKRHPHVRHVRHAGQRKNEAYTHGKAAGRKIVLHRGVTAPSTSPIRLLPAKNR